MWTGTKKNRLNDLGKKQGSEEDAKIADAYVMLIRAFNWTPNMIDEVELGVYYSLCESFEKFPPHYMIFPVSVGYEPPSDVKWKDFEKKLHEQEQDENALNSLFEAFNKMSG